MKLPWNKIEELENEIQQLETRLENEKQRSEKLENMLEAEKKRRKKHAREKQEAEQKLNQLKDKLRNLENQPDKTKESSERPQLQPVSFDKAVSILEKLDSLESREKDLVTVYSSSKIEELDDLKDLKNSISKNQYNQIQGLDSFTGFLDRDTGNTVLELRPFFDSKFVLEKFYDIKELLDFIRSEKHWVLVSAGNTRVFHEENGEYKQIESIKSRVDREHSKGGFSQGRFERKRDEQIEKHVKQVKKALKDFDKNFYLLGDKKLCEDLPGEYLGGFDPNMKRPEQFYQFRLKRF